MPDYSIRIRDPVHGFIHLSDRELKLVGSRAFSRLRNIKQLALTYLVYPGAMHTRFEHSLGVMELATKAFDALDSKFPSELKTNFDKLNLKVEEARTLLRATALLHDVGHLPFSHGGEEVLPKKADGKRNRHEDVSLAVVRQGEVADILRTEFYEEIVDQICLLLDEAGSVPPELLILKKIISGQFDADKMDYLCRDSLHCGVGYGNFDYLRLLETTRIKKAEEGGLELSVERGGLHTLEAMVLARYWMFTQVYYHKTRRIFDIYLSRYLNSWYSGQYDNLLGVLDQDDVTVMGDMIRDSKSEELETAERRKWALRIINRDHHRVVYETSVHALPEHEKAARKVEKALKEKYPDVDFVSDLEARGTLHKFYVKDVDEELGEEFPIFDRVSGHYSRLSEESKVFAKLPKRFRVIRIYADVPKESLPTYRNFAAEKAREFEGVI